MSAVQGVLQGQPCAAQAQGQTTDLGHAVLQFGQGRRGFVRVQPVAQVRQ